MTNLDKLDAEISAYMQIVADIENRLVNLALQGGAVLTAEEQIFENIYKSEYDRLHAHVTSMLHKRNEITA